MPVRASLAIGAAVLLLATSGCSPEAAQIPKPDPEYGSDYEEPEPTDIAPLRGTSVAAGSLTNPAIAAKIDNHPDARPQVGLERTDIVFEELVEGGLTRYVAVWQSDIPELLGPVRSIRPMDPDIISPFGGIVAYSGGQERFVQLMRSTPVYNAIHGQSDTASTFYRSDAKDAPHNVIVKAQEVVAAHADLTSPAQQFAFSSDVPSSTAAKDGAPTAAVNYRFSAVVGGSWTWDAAQLAFLRAQDGAPDVDGSGAQLKSTNVVVLRVPVSMDTGVPKSELLGTGEAWISTGSGTTHATWLKGAAADAIRLVDDNGVVVRLAPGNTWIELIPATGSVEFVPSPAS